MLSLDFIRQHPDVVREALHRRGDTQSIDEILRLAEQRRGLVTRCEGLYASLKRLHEVVRTASTESARAETNAQIKATTHDVRLLEIQISDIETRMQPLLLALPNLPHAEVGNGGERGENTVLRTWGEPLTYYFTPRAHWELSDRLGLTDFESGARIGGSRFVVLKGAGARLERALISYMLDIHTREHQYTEILPPFLVKRSLMLGSGQLPQFEDQAYVCTEDALYLNPTAEVALLGLHADSILPKGTLPLRYVGWTTAFRREAGAGSLQTRGLLRLHQFNRVELFQLVEPHVSYEVHAEMVGHAERVLRNLALPYRVVERSARNLPFSAAKTFDLEVWMPGQARYVAISSLSNSEAFQARRAEIKYRPSSSGRSEYAHIVSGSGLIVGHTMAAILESYQQADGTVIVPKVLRPYMGTAVLSGS